MKHDKRGYMFIIQLRITQKLFLILVQLCKVFAAKVFFFVIFFFYKTLTTTTSFILECDIFWYFFCIELH